MLVVVVAPRAFGALDAWFVVVVSANPLFGSFLKNFGTEASQLLRSSLKNFCFHMVLVLYKIIKGSSVGNNC